MLPDWLDSPSIGPRTAAGAVVVLHCKQGDQWFWSNCVINGISGTRPASIREPQLQQLPFGFVNGANSGFGPTML